nr:hypothetical protein [Tanacetum cinerariifolium]
EEEVSSDDEETEVKALMALTNEERISFGKESARNGDESSVCSTPLLPLKKLDGAEPNSGPKTINSILKSKSTFKAETLEDDPPLAMEIKELNELKLQISKKQSSYSGNKNTQQVPLNALQNKYKTQFKMNCELYGQNNHLSKNCYEVLFSKKCKRTNQRTYDHAEFMSSIHTNQHHTSQGESSSRSRPSRPSVSFPSYIYCGYNNHHFDDCLYYPTCELCGSYDHNTHDHHMIISQRRGINPRNPQHVIKNYETCGSNVHTTSDHNDIEWFRKRETPHAKKTESLNALRSKTPTKIKPFTKSPKMYQEYLAEFWYSAKALENSKVSFSIPTGGIYEEVGLNTFRNAIGVHYLPHSSDDVAPPSIDVVRKWFPTIGYGEEVSTKGTLKKSLLPLRWRLPMA